MRVPQPGLLSIVIRPPEPSAKLRAMARPRPVPRPTGLVVKKGSPARARVSAVIPAPVSATVTLI